MKNLHKALLFVLGVGVVGLFFVFFGRESFPIPEGETQIVGNDVSDGGRDGMDTGSTEGDVKDSSDDTVQENGTMNTSPRTLLITEGVTHSIPLDEILSGGPGKDGIPSIDAPVFLSAEDADFLEDSNVGIGLTYKGESRFYPYRILVWHEIVNDTIAGDPVLVTYCPLCATGIVFDRRVDGVEEEFGVSGNLWQSNLLMYNRAQNPDDESLWSQVLGEAVLGIHTGKRLEVVRSDIVRWSDWRAAHPDTRVLSTDTGESRNYGRDPYGDYYTSESVSFGASFSDTRLHPKALVHGIEIDGQYKAYHEDVLRDRGVVEDTFAGAQIRITFSDTGELRVEADGNPLPSIPGFWFSWLAVHPETVLFK